MTIKPDHAEPCWEIIDLADGANYYADNDYQPHYPTRAKAAEAIAEIVADRHADDELVHLVARPAFATPCVELVCDRCSYVFDEDEYATHFDPADPFPVPLSDYDWTVERRIGLPDRHYCTECGRGEWCDACDDQHHGTCPDPSRRPVLITEGQEVIPW